MVINKFIQKILPGVVLAFLFIFSCEKDTPTPPNGETSKIEFTEITTSNISYRSATISTNIPNTYGITIEQHGHCWSTEQNPDLTDSISERGTLTSNTFSSNLSNLEPNTSYYIRAYVKFGDIIRYSEIQTLLTTVAIGFPVVTTKEVTNITAFAAESGGEITENNGGEVTARGICWNKAGNPAISDSITINENGMGSFTSNLTNLEFGTRYFVKAYATNEAGTSYGNEIIFRTDTLATIVTSDITNITAISATAGGNITDDGDANITSRGICYNNTGMPTINDSVSYSGNGTGSFNVNLENLYIDSTYYVRAFAINEAGVSYGEEKSFKTKDGIPVITTTAITNITATSAQSGGNITDDGGLPVLARGICWNITGNPTLNDSITFNGNGTGSFTSNMGNLIIDTTYYVRAYATNEMDTTYGTQIEFDTKDGIPTLTTTEITDITATSATSGGNITNDGGLTITVRGVCWSTTTNPTISDSHTSDGSGTGSFTSNITGLTELTTYYVRAYATNSNGTAYGNEMSSTTDVQCPGSVTDIDGNTYSVVKIGNQCWMAKNLEVTKYRDETNIPEITDNIEWDNATTGAYCYYDNNSSYGNTYGKLYNYYAISDSKGLCPSGWHVPSDTEWNELISNYGGLNIAGNALKETGTAHWPDGGGTNIDGFTALPGGTRSGSSGLFYNAPPDDASPDAWFWSISIYNSGNGYTFRLHDGTEQIYHEPESMESGCSVRCIKD